MTEKAAKVLKKEEEKHKSLPRKLLPGAIGGTVGTVATMPIDVIKDLPKTYASMAASARNVGNVSEAARLEHVSQNMFRMAKEVYRTQGIKGFYKGTGASIAKIAPSMALIMATTKAVENKMDKK